MWRFTACVFIILLVNGPNPQSLQFVTTPSDVVITPGSNHTLTCTVTPQTSNLIIWYRDNVPVNLGGRVTSGNGGTELVITRVQRSDAGRYACEASSSEGSLRSLGAVIQVAFLEPLSNTPSAPLLRVHLGDSFILNCSLPNSLPEASVQWFRGSTDVLTLPDANRFTVSSSATSSSLIASYFVITDSNNYDCQISNPVVGGAMVISYTAASVTRESGDTIIALTQSFVVRPQDVEVVAGRSAKLQCFVVGQPIPTILWQRGSVLLASSTNITFSQSKRVLELQNVQPSDAGVYTCTSSQDQVTMINNITTTATLSVIVPPRIVEGVAHQEVLVGATIQLRCVAEGTPPIIWEWQNNTNQVLGDDRVTVDNGQLTISNAQVSDSGVYQCVASHVTNEQDGASHSVIVTTQQPSFLPGGNPTDTLSFTGQSVQLICDAMGAPPPQYSWTKDTSILDISVPRIMREEGSGTITITSVRKGQDDGSYYCTASNSDGSVDSRTALLRVLELPDVLYSPSNEVVAENSSTTIPCGVVIPNVQSVTIQYLWFLDDTQLDISSQQYQLQEGNLTIFSVQVEDAGEYTCIVNISDSGLISVDDLQFRSISRGIISVAVLPSSTGVPVVSNIQSTEVMVSWGSPPSDGGSPITHYIIESRVAATYGTFPVQAGGNWITAINSVSGNSTVVPSLRPFTRYEFRVIVVNLAGRGPASSPSNIITTLEAAPTAAPTMLNVMTRLESTELLVTLQPPPVRLPDGDGRNGIVVNYTVKYQLNGSQQEAEMMTTTDNTTSLLLEGLQHSSAYSVMVAASTSPGTGPFTLPVIQSTLNFVPRPPDPPDMLTAITANSTTVVLQWREPPLTTTANVTGYLVQYEHPARENNSNISVSLPSHVQTITVTDLDGGQLYQFNVSAINTVGTGLPAIHTLSTPIGSPTHILSFSGNRLSSNAVVLSWDAPPDGGSELYGFIVEGYSIFEVGWLELDVLPANVTTYQLSADEGAVYTDVRVSAFNQFGTSASIVFNVGNPEKPDEDAPNTIWFLVIFVLFGLVLVAFAFLTIVLISKKCMGEYSGGKYSFRDTDDSEIASSAPSTTTFTNFESRSRKSNAPLFSSEAAPFYNEPRPPSPRTQSPMLSESNNSRLMPQGYPYVTNAHMQDNSTLMSGYSIDRPMFSDTTSTDSPAPLGGDYQRGFTGGAQGQQMGLQERDAKTRSLENNVSTYV